jgi:hypothetical protein
MIRNGLELLPFHKKLAAQYAKVLNKKAASAIKNIHNIDLVMMLCAGDLGQTLQLHKMKPQFQQRDQLDQLADQNQ